MSSSPSAVVSFFASGKKSQDIACVAMAIASGFAVSLSVSASAAPVLPAMSLPATDRVVTLFGVDNIARYFLRAVGSECEGLESMLNDASSGELCLALLESKQSGNDELLLFHDGLRTQSCCTFISLAHLQNEVCVS